jgi:hypothetical protein
VAVTSASQLPGARPKPIVAGIIGVVCVAIHREETNLTLTSEATDQVTREGRWLNGMGVHAPHRFAAADRETMLIWPADRVGDLPDYQKAVAPGQSPVSARAASSSSCSIGASRPGLPAHPCAVTHDQPYREGRRAACGMHDGRGYQRHGNPGRPWG